MSKLLVNIYFKSSGTERSNKVLKAKKDIANLFCQKELTIPEANGVLSDLKIYFKYLEQEELKSAKVHPFEHV